MLKKTLGEGHPEVAKCLNNLAVLLREQKKFEDAETLTRQGLEVVRQALGDSHPFVATSMNNLAMILEDQSKFAEAEPLYRHALHITRSVRVVVVVDDVYDGVDDP